MNTPQESKSFFIRRYPFTRDTINLLAQDVWLKDLWPIVYILSSPSQKQAYVGESTSAIDRLQTHLAHHKKGQMDWLHLITSPHFHKSATLDIESSLIRYLNGDDSSEKYHLLNGNLGLTFHNYYEKQHYHTLFTDIWQQLKDEKIAIQDLKDIDNSNLFKFSPYKALTPDQYQSVLELVDMLNSPDTRAFVKGGAGTGKTVLAIFLIKLLVTPFEELYDLDMKAEDGEDATSPDRKLIRQLKEKYPSPKVALVVPMTPFRNTLKAVFSSMRGLHANMVVGPSEVVGNNYDILIVDEAHRLRQRQNITNFRSFDENNRILGLGHEGTELDWVLRSSQKQIFFYDRKQSVKPSDVGEDRFLHVQQTSRQLQLHSQLRVKGGNDYITYIEQLLHLRLPKNAPQFKQEDYDFVLFDSIADFSEAIAQKENEHGLARMTAGYSWEWKSKKEPTAMDIEIEGITFQWNQEYNQWIHSENAAREIGCIHTTQGYDLNYVGVIFGKEISYNPTTNEIEIHKEHFYDKKTKAGIKDISKLKGYILNIYQNMLYRGIKGVFVYTCDLHLRNYFKRYIPTYTSQTLMPSPVMEKVIINSVKAPEGNYAPYYDISVAAGDFSDTQQSDIAGWVVIPDNYKHAGRDYFVCRVVGESMNRRIPNGSLCLFQKYQGGSREGLIVLVAHYDIQDADFGAGYTVKEYHSLKKVDADGWQHQSITLQPLSDDDSFTAIELSHSAAEGLKIIGVFVSLL
ncbi:DUF2075 domain-containing protein [Chitinophaga filiformis]|uniref:DNA/RNA helicase domain-containing protein n=1 Tax=Chitinophaga filiformis TaxID=104663 RepID=UPI001F4666E9|nr:DNA/RNA helicase domain-containing protein [Chitinophaga filiformis]MCF6403570.1 DUF2075 domain-containing protein [Chitinophaga filiformis]